MLTAYFLRCFFYYHTLFFSILLALFASCNVFIRLPFIHSISVIPLVAWTMLPLVALFALPLASSLAVCTTLMTHTSYDELLALSFLRPARHALYKALIIFSLLCCAAYGLLVFELVPQSYRAGKELLLKVAREHLVRLEPNKFHAPFPSFNFFFKEKMQRDNNTLFGTLFLVFTPKKNTDEQYFFTAREGFFKNTTLILYDGSVYTFKNRRFHVASFKQTEIALHQFLNPDNNALQLSGIKFLTWRPLLALYSQDHGAFAEIHKRLAQVVWQAALPILGFMSVVLMHVHTLLSCIVLCGGLYLLSYVVIVFAQAFASPLLMLLFLYLPLVVLLALGLYLYKKRRLLK